METPVSRRTLLGVGSAAAALSIAGCGASTENEPQGTHEATLVADIDEGEMQTAQQEAQAAQQDAQQRFEDGEIDREEAQQIVQEAQVQVQQVQQELLSEAVGEIESYAEDKEGFAITESAPESGVALGEGSADALVEALSIESVQAIIDAAEFEAFRDD